MKSCYRALFAGLVLAMILLPAAAPAQPGGLISLYHDAAGTDCNVEVNQPGTVTLYIVHTLAYATASQFRIVNHGFAGTFVGLTVVPPNLYHGDPDIFTNGAFAYTSCQAGPWLIASMQWYFGGVPSCGILEVEPAVGQTDVLAADCQPTPQFIIATGGRLAVNADAQYCRCQPVDTEPNTWSRIKVLYR